MFHFAVELQPSSESVEVCLGTAVEVNCTTGTNNLVWTTSPQCIRAYSKDNTELVGVVRTFCDFEAILFSINQSLMSMAILRNVNPSHNGTVLTCANTLLISNLERIRWLAQAFLYEVTFTTNCTSIHIYTYLVIGNSYFRWKHRNSFS